jgi:hypothetical protein
MSIQYNAEYFHDMVTALRFNDKLIPNKYIAKLVNAIVSVVDTIVTKTEEIARADLVIITLFITFFSNTLVL